MHQSFMRTDPDLVGGAGAGMQNRPIKFGGSSIA